MLYAELLQKKSIETKLCCHCGICAGICPVQAISCEHNTIHVDASKCINCGLCTTCCPSGGYPLSDVTLSDIKEIPCYTAASNDASVRANASSGGFVTQTLLTLLEQDSITAAAVVLPGDTLQESLAKYIVTSDPDIILQARRSKYTQATMDRVIQHIMTHEGRYAVVGLPCQLYALSQAMIRLPLLKKRIIYKLGMVCGFTYDEQCIDGLVKVMEISPSSVHRVLGWREGGLPGSFSVELNNGTAANLPFADEHSVDVTYYAQNRCRLCKDCLCEHGDVVSADIGGWKEKKTLVLARSSAGHQLLEQLSRSGALSISPCTIPYEQTVLPFMLREKRAKVDLRLSSAKKSTVMNWLGGYAPKLLLAQKISARLSIYFEKKATKNIDRHSAKRMLMLGHWAYHRTSSWLWIKILFKLETYLIKFCHIFNSKLRKISFLYGKTLGNARPFLRKDHIRAAVIGLGNWGSQYLHFLSRSPYFKLVAAYDFDQKKLQALEKKYHFATADSIEDLCTNYDADAVFVLTPTPTHEDVYAAVSKHPLPVYMEKPLCSNLKAANSIAVRSHKCGQLLYVAHSMKYEPIIIEVKKLLSENTVGNLVSFEMTRTVRGHTSAHYENAALYQIGVHLIDIMLHLFGPPTSITNRKITISDNVNYEDILVSMQDSITGTLRYGFSNEYNFHLKIVGLHGTIVYGDSHMTVKTGNTAQEIFIPMKNEKTIYSQLDEFYSSVRKGTAVLNTTENALSVMRICDEIIKQENANEHRQTHASNC